MSSYCVLLFKKWIIGWGFEASLDNGISVEYYQKKKKKTSEQERDEFKCNHYPLKTRFDF